MLRRISVLFPLWVAISMLIPAVIGGLINMSWTGALLGFLWGGVVRMFLVHHAMWTSGSTAHILGSRPFRTRDMSTNNPVLALPKSGAGSSLRSIFPFAFIGNASTCTIAEGTMYSGRNFRSAASSSDVRERASMPPSRFDRT